MQPPARFHFTMRTQLPPVINQVYHSPFVCKQQGAKLSSNPIPLKPAIVMSPAQLYSLLNLHYSTSAKESSIKSTFPCQNSASLYLGDSDSGPDFRTKQDASPPATNSSSAAASSSIKSVISSEATVTSNCLSNAGSKSHHQLFLQSSAPQPRLH